MNKSSIFTRKGVKPKGEPTNLSTSKQLNPTLSRSKSSTSTSAELEKSTFSKRLIRRRAEEQRAKIRPDYKEYSSSDDTEKALEQPPIVRKRKGLLPSLDVPPAAYPPSTIPKSAPTNVPEAETEFPFEKQEKSTHTIEQQE